MSVTVTHTIGFTASHTQALPGWHPCARIHGHHWDITLVTVTDGVLPDTDAAEQRLAFDEIDAWTAEHVDHHHLNALHDSLRASCGPYEVGAWLYNRWAHRLPQLREVRVAGPPRDSEPGVTPVYTYTPTRANNDWSDR